MLPVTRKGGNGQRGNGVDENGNAGGVGGGTPRFLLLLLLPATQCALIEQSSVFSDVTPVYFYLFTVVSCLVRSNRERPNYFIKSLDHRSSLLDTTEDTETFYR